MEYKNFWDIVEKSINADSCDEINKIIKKELEKLSIEELVSYQKKFHKLYNRLYTWDLWSIAYIIKGGCGDDGFMDFRGSIISLGREIYESTILNPDFLINLDEIVLSEKIYNEEFKYLAPLVYAEKTSKNMYEENDFQIESEEPLGDKIDFESKDIEKIFIKKYPKLMKEYW